MTYEPALDRLLPALGVAALGLQCLIFSRFVLGLKSVPASLVSPVPWTWWTSVASRPPSAPAGWWSLALAERRPARGGEIADKATDADRRESRGVTIAAARPLPLNRLSRRASRHGDRRAQGRNSVGRIAYPTTKAQSFNAGESPSTRFDG